MSQYQIAKLFGNAFAKAATMETAIHSFAKPGLWPLNPNAFTDVDFAPSDVTERDENLNEHRDELIGEDRRTPSPQPEQVIDNNESNNAENELLESSSSKNASFQVTPKDVCPVPKGSRKPSNRKRGKAAILTSTPYKEELEQGQNPKAKSVKRKVNFASSIKPKKKVAVQNDSSSDSDSNSDEDDPHCAMCNKLYSKSKQNEGWVQCRICARWFHEACTRESPESLVTFICIKCL